MASPDLFKLLKKVWTKHGWTATVNRLNLVLGSQDPVTGWFGKGRFSQQISMYILTKSMRWQVLRQGLFIAYDANGYTKDTVKEGDWILENNGQHYLVVTVCARSILNEFRYNEVGLVKLPKLTAADYTWNKWDDESGAFNRVVRTIEMNSAGSSLKTLYRLSLGARDSVTGWYAKTYAAGVQIKCPVLDVSASPAYLRMGIQSTYIHRGFTQATVAEGDVILDYDGEYYRIREIKPVQVGDHLAFQALTLERLQTWQAAEMPVPPAFTLSILSRYVGSLSDSNLGQYSLDSGALTNLPGSEGTTLGAHTVGWVYAGYLLDHWEYSDNISSTDVTANPVSIMLESGASGVLRAVYAHDISSWATFYDMYFGMLITIDRFSFAYVNLQVDTTRFVIFYEDTHETNGKRFALYQALTTGT